MGQVGYGGLTGFLPGGLQLLKSDHDHPRILFEDQTDTDLETSKSTKTTA
jgi:hypothetical protein